MDDRELDALMFAVNEKANMASSLMQRCNTKHLFYKGQFMAYSEIYTMLKQTKERNNHENII